MVTPGRRQLLYTRRQLHNTEFQTVPSSVSLTHIIAHSCMQPNSPGRLTLAQTHSHVGRHTSTSHKPQYHTAPSIPWPCAGGLHRELAPSSTTLPSCVPCIAARCSVGRPLYGLTGSDYCCQPHIRRELNGREPPPASGSLQ